jgi:hypothetical protein
MSPHELKEMADRGMDWKGFISVDLTTAHGILSAVVRQPGEGTSRAPRSDGRLKIRIGRQLRKLPR